MVYVHISMQHLTNCLFNLAVHKRFCRRVSIVDNKNYLDIILLNILITVCILLCFICICPFYFHFPLSLATMNED